VAAVEALCPDERALLLLRSSPAVGSFLKRWNLSVYFTLRFQQVRRWQGLSRSGGGLVTAGRAELMVSAGCHGPAVRLPVIGLMRFVRR
jgi:hypothetical protein